jgi:PAS domain S-box-containing protein
MSHDPLHPPGEPATPSVVARAFVTLAENARDYAIFLMDPEGIVTHWGEGARLISWWTKAQAEGAHLRLLYPDDGAEDGTAEEHLAQAAATGEYVGEGQRIRSDRSTFWASVTLTALRDTDGVLLGFANVTRDLTAHRAAEAALRAAQMAEAARQAAEAATRAKSEFLATVSHEIRTPVNAILGYTDLLDAGIGGPLADAQRDYVVRARASGRHLLGLIEDLLDLSRLEADRVAIRPQAARLGDVVRGALDAVAPQAAAAGVRLADAVASHAADVAYDIAYWGDEARVRQVLINLLANAVKFTEPGGLVTVSAGTAARPSPDARVTGDGPWAYVRVEDTGGGIPPEQLESVFEPFVQADMRRTRRHGGTGLGLTISRRLARLMGGDLTARSTPGLGSTFSLWLPAAPAGAVVASTEGPHPSRDSSDDRSGARFAMGETPAGRRAPLVDGAPPTRPLSSLRDVSDAITAELESILDAYVARLQHDPATPSAHSIESEALENHLTTFLADVAQTLVAPELVTDVPAESLRDGTVIQRLVAERHGAQRFRLGWKESEVRREFAILGEELAAAVRRRPPRGPSPEARASQAEGAIAALRQFLDRAETISRESFRASVSRRPAADVPATQSPTRADLRSES